MGGMASILTNHTVFSGKKKLVKQNAQIPLRELGSVET